jgi:hypothetical protein
MGISVRLKIGSLFWTAIPNGLPKNCARPDLTLLPPRILPFRIILTASIPVTFAKHRGTSHSPSRARYLQ